MPLDPRIPLGAQAPQIGNPFLEGFSRAFEIRHQQAQQQQATELHRVQLAQEQFKLKEAQDKAREDDEYKQAIQASAGMTPDQFLEHVRAHAPGSFVAVQKAIQETNDKAASAKHAMEQAAAAHAQAGLHQQAYIGHLADQIDQSDYNPFVVNAALNDVVQQFPDWKDHADQIRQIAQEQGKAGLQSVIRPMIDAAAMKTRADAANAAAETPGKVASSAIQQQVAAGTVGGMTPDQQATAIARGMTNRIAQGNLNLATKREGREQAKDDLLTGAGVGPDGKALPESPVARGMAEYRIPPPSPRSLSTGPGQALMRQVTAINPAYDATQFQTRQKMRNAFTSGPQSQTLNSLNTAIEHLDQFADAAKALGNGNFKPGNAAYNWVREQFGNTAPTDFKGIRTIMSGELASAFKKSGATDQEIHQVQSSIDGANSTDQLVSYVTKIAIPALGAKAETSQQQYRGVMGDKDPWSVYTPGARKVLDKYGAGHAATEPTASGTVRMQTPDGRLVDIPADKVGEATKRGAKKVGG